MKKLYFSVTLLLFTALSASAQLQIDKSIDLTGSGSNAKVTGIKEVSTATDAVNVQTLQGGRLVTATGVSGTNSIVLTFSPPIAAATLQGGTMINFKAAGNNTGAVTLTVDGIAAKNLYKDVSSALAADDIKANQMVTVIYDGTNFQLLSRGEFTAADGSASNEGTLGVDAGGASSSVITSNTAGATGVTLNVGTGLSIAESPSPNGGSVTLSNSAPDQTVSLSNGTGISVGGSYPSFTVTNTAPDQTVALNSGTGISVTGAYPSFTVANTGVTSVGTGSGLTGGPITTTGTIGIASAGITNAMLANPSVTINSGTGLSGGGTVALGGTLTLNNTGVTSVGTGAGLTGGPITTTGTIGIASAGVTNAMLANSSVTINTGTGLSGGGAVALGGTLNLVNTAPDQTVSLASGLGISVTGSYPSFTITNSGVRSVATGSGLTGGPITSTGTVSIASAGVTNAMLQNSSLTVSAGTGLSGGGTISLGGSTTLNLANTGVTSGTFGNGTQVGTFTVDAQGRLTAAGNTPINSWIKIAEVDISGSSGYTFTGLDGNSQEMYKVVFQGTNSGGGSDRRILIRPNSATSTYNGYAIYDGSSGGADWETTGLYVGRTGYGLNGDIGFEYVLSALTGRKRVGWGLGTFVHTNNSILGYHSNSFWTNTTSNITSLQVLPNGGTITGRLQLFALQ